MQKCNAALRDLLWKKSLRPLYSNHRSDALLLPVSLDVDRWYSSSQSPIKFEACRTSSRGRLFPFLGIFFFGSFFVGPALCGRLRYTP
ncbi:hypothetical protein F3P66_20145 [Agrobacterium fabrum]|uniref:Uncharacterized protein n=1 Tax=Agrobacterium fabrum (strain C58 / ATCC 33970) TaxID=176299 RepID=A9CG30_AGRFC|nr:hypothetical protein Atu4111 [Agrobacterium fabrum str. C58]QRM61698.1 hypothetical protein F3P66_20145 [Agrobacterium fabrum]TRB24315.1 hypothetical protein EXN51_24950 [Agrobacterium fabrum]